MRTNIEIDEDLVTRAMQAAGVRTKRAAVEQALRLLVQLSAQKDAVEDLAGLGWDGDLEASRQGRTACRTA